MRLESPDTTMLIWSENKFRFTVGAGCLASVGMLSEFWGQVLPFWVVLIVSATPLFLFWFADPEYMPCALGAWRPTIRIRVVFGRDDFAADFIDVRASATERLAHLSFVRALGSGSLRCCALPLRLETRTHSPFGFGIHSGFFRRRQFAVARRHFSTRQFLRTGPSEVSKRSMNREFAQNSTGIGDVFSASGCTAA